MLARSRCFTRESDITDICGVPRAADADQGHPCRHLQGLPRFNCPICLARGNRSSPNESADRADRLLLGRRLVLPAFAEGGRIILIKSIGLLDMDCRMSSANQPSTLARQQPGCGPGGAASLHSFRSVHERMQSKRKW